MYRWLVIALSLVVTGSSAASQQGTRPRPAGSATRIEWTVQVLEALPPQDPNGPYRLFFESETLDFAIRATNGSPEAVWANHSRVAEATTASVSRDTTIAVRPVWHSEYRRSSGEVISAPLESPVLLESREAVTWTVSLLRADGEPFSAGLYRVKLTVSPTAAFLTVDGRAVESASGGPRGEVVIAVRPAASDDDLALMLQGQISTASQRLDHGAALVAALALLKLRPTDEQRVQVGLLYAALGRYDEAVSFLEARLPAEPRSSFDLAAARRLALAYVGIGDEARAASLLRRIGVSEDQVASQLEELRRDVGNRSR